MRSNRKRIVKASSRISQQEEKKETQEIISSENEKHLSIYLGRNEFNPVPESHYSVFDILDPFIFGGKINSNS